MPYSTATWEQDQHLQKTFKGESISEDEYHRKVEEFAGACKCGGKYLFDAQPRCPECRSLKMEHVPGVIVHYD